MSLDTTPAGPPTRDLTDLVDTEHIRGSMPADATARDAARAAFYQRLRQLRAHPNPWQDPTTTPEDA